MLKEGAPVDVGFLLSFSSVPLSWASFLQQWQRKEGKRPARCQSPRAESLGAALTCAMRAGEGRMWRANEVSLTLLRFASSLCFLRQPGRISIALFTFSPRSECNFSSTPKAVGWGKETEKGRGRDEGREEGQEICSSVLYSGFPADPSSQIVLSFSFIN